MSRQKPDTFLQTFFDDFFWTRVGAADHAGFYTFREEFFEDSGQSTEDRLGTYLPRITARVRGTAP
jgi:hypothetical protein